jgi:hypothetical protein
LVLHSRNLTHIAHGGQAGNRILFHNFMQFLVTKSICHFPSGDRRISCLSQRGGVRGGLRRKDKAD